VHTTDQVTEVLQVEGDSGLLLGAGLGGRDPPGGPQGTYTTTYTTTTTSTTSSTADTTGSGHQWPPELRGDGGGGSADNGLLLGQRRATLDVLGLVSLQTLHGALLGSVGRRRRVLPGEGGPQRELGPQARRLPERRGEHLHGHRDG